VPSSLSTFYDFINCESCKILSYLSKRFLPLSNPPQQISFRSKIQAKHWRFNMRFPASRAATRAGKSLSFFEDIPAGKTVDGEDGEPSLLSRHGARNMREMIEHFPLPNSKSLREFFCGHFSFAEEGDHSLAKSLLLVHFAQ
jgi:hypothetical protein